MSTVILEQFSQSSKAYKLGYILLGYGITFIFTPLLSGGNSNTYLVTIAFVGGFIGTFLVFLKPLKVFLHFFYNRYYKKEKSKEIPATVYYSPYLGEAKGEIIGGILFSLTCYFSIISVNFSLITDINFKLLLQIGLFIFGSIILWRTKVRFDRLKRRFDLLELYYDEVKKRVYIGRSLQVVDDLRLALNRQDWQEGFAIEHKYNEMNKERERKKQLPHKPL